MTTIQDRLCGACGQPLSSPGLPELPEETDLEETESGVADAAGEKAGVPDWLRDLPSPSGAEGRPSAEEQGRSEIERTLSPAPPPLAPREGGSQERAADLIAGPETGTRRMPGGERGELPIAEFFSQPAAVPAGALRRAAQDPPGPATESSDARLFAEIVTPAPRKASAAAARSPAPLLAHLPRWLLYALLIAAVTWPLVAENPWAWLSGLVPGADFGAPRSMTATPAALDIYHQIGSLDAGAPVLIAFDYDPATAGEMDVVAGALLEHLLDREVQIVTISLLPAGPATAERLLQTVMANRPATATGLGYVNLGYLPGKEAAVRLLGRRLATVLPVDFTGNRLGDLAVMEPINTLQSFSLILVLTSSHEHLRWWIEQAGAPYQVKLAAGVSASLEPLARPYYETTPRQIAGMIGGVPGAAVYVSLHHNGEGASGLPLERGMSARLDAQAAGHLVLILVILGGTAISPVLTMVRRAMRRER